MKNQYVCDIGDFGKYLLLNRISSSPNDAKLSLGINWFRTCDDGTNYGKYTNYLSEDKHNLQNSFSPLSNQIYEKLQKISIRSLESIETGNVLPPDTLFFNKHICNGGRYNWIDESINKLSKCDTIFLDPDNGISFNDNGKDLSKYVLLSDLQSYFDKTISNIIIYHHGARQKGGLEKYSIETIYPKVQDICPNSSIRILWYHKGTARLYIFIIRHNESIINDRIDALLSEQKNRLFTEIKFNS